MSGADIIALIAAWILLSFLFALILGRFFAVGNPRNRQHIDEASDDLADRISHGDVRLADLLNSSHPDRPSR